VARNAAAALARAHRRIKLHEAAVDAVDGSMRVPQKPGLGVDVAERVLECCRAA